VDAISLISLCFFSDKCVSWRIRLWANQQNCFGILPQAKDKDGKLLRGRYVLGVAVPRAFEYTRESLVSDDPDEARYRKARAAKEECAAAAAQIELDYQRGKYVLVSEVQEQGTAMMLCCRSRLLAIPSSISRSLIGKTDFKEICLIVEGAIHAALHEIADLAELGRKDRERATRELIRQGEKQEHERIQSTTDDKPASAGARR